MKILLILPAAEHYRVTHTHPQVPRRAMLRFSLLSLTTVAALTPPEHEVRICDENVEPVDLDVDVDLVGISFMTALAPRAYELAAAFRRRGRITVAGGYHPTLCPADAAAHFDSVVVGNAEGAWEQLLQDVQHGTPQRVYQHGTPCSLAHAPIPRRELTRRTARHYATINAVQTGRGCVHHCTYCSIAAFHQGAYRTRPLEHVLEDVRRVPRNFIFVDDNIIADPAYARALFTALIPLKKRWVSQGSLTIADDPALLELAYDAGCRGLFIGIENLNPENLRAVDKTFNDVNSYHRRIRAIRRQGIGVIAGVIVGMDQDDPTVFETMLRFLQRAHVDAVQVNIMTPLPGTLLYDEFARAGRITDGDWSHYDFRHCVMRPLRMTSDQLQDGADWLYRQFYRLDLILLRALHTLCTCGLLPALLTLKLNLTYRYDNIREHIVGANPAIAPRRAWTAWQPAAAHA
jgi:radical SAM superfamily enzyme YgiQ (UPF0313 family)